MKDRLAVISTKNPRKDVLLKTIGNLKTFYDEFDIVIIDSDSDDKSAFYTVPRDCMIEYCKNKNWELGAWVYAFNKYNNYKVYMFIQDSLIPNNRIPLDKTSFDNGTIYTYTYHAKLKEGGHLEELRNVYKNTSLDFLSKLDENTLINGGAHSFFITDHEHVNNILQLENAFIEKNIEKSKIHSLLAERTIGILADTFSKRIDVHSYFTKINGGRD
jgi:hypothetical protein